ncbi:MAG: hypothetical protein Q9208_008558 [Pyrenodesmia sp. 3 TL-2023]
MATQETPIEAEEKGELTIYRSPHFSYSFYTTYALTYTDQLDHDELVKSFASNRKALSKLSSDLQTNKTHSGHHAKAIELWQHHLTALSQKTDALYKEHRDLAREIWNRPIAWRYLTPSDFGLPELER